MITNIDVSQEIFVMDILKALKSSFKHHHKHVLRLLQLYGDQTLKSGSHSSATIGDCKTKNVIEFVQESCQ